MVAACHRKAMASCWQRSGGRKGELLMGDFIKIDRKILKWEWWSDIKTFRLFMYMLISANWKDGNFKGILIPRGSFVSSIPKLASETCLSEREVRTAIKHLKLTGELTVKTTNKFSVFTINNYCLYQDNDMQNVSQVTDNRQSNDMQNVSQVTTIEEIKKKEIKNNKEYITDTSVSVRRTKDVQRIVDEWNSLKKYGIKAISKLSSTSTRYKSLVARINEYSVDDVLKAIDNIRNSNFLQGKVKKSTWVITFDWFVLPNNFPKVLEGQYNDNERKEVTTYESESTAQLW